MNTTIPGSIELISTVGSLHIGHFLLHTGLFSIDSAHRIVRGKRPKKIGELSLK
jgi:hypothetical protein